MRHAQGLWVVLVLCACATLPNSPAPEATQSPPGTATPTATATLPATLVATPQPTPSPTPAAVPDAISAATAGDIRQTQTMSGHSGPVYGVAVTANGSLVASGGTDHTVRVWDVATGQPRYVFERHEGWVYALAFTPDGEQLVSGARDRRLMVWNVANGKYLYGLRAMGEPFDIAISADGQWLTVAQLYSAAGQMWPLQPGAAWTLLEGHSTRLRSAAFSPDGGLLATGDADGLIILREPASGQPQAELQTPGGDANALVFSPDGQFMLVGSRDGFIRSYDLASLTESASWLAHGGGVTTLSLTRYGDVLASGGMDNTIQLWDPLTGQRLATAGSHAAPVRRVALALDGSLLVSGGDDGLLRVFQIVSVP